MTQKYGCLQFPFEEDTAKQCLRKTATVNDTLKSAIRCFLITSPGQRRGNNIGSFLPTLKHQIMNKSALKAAEDQLKQELSFQFPRVDFEYIELKQQNENEVSVLHVRIAFSTNYTDVEELVFSL